MMELMRDIRYSLRLLIRNPGVSLITILILAVGISASSAIFSVNYSVLIRQLPYPDSERLAMLWVKEQDEQNSKSGASYSDIGDWKAQSSAFDKIEMFDWATLDLIGMGEPERISAMKVSAGFLQMLGVQPSAGRAFAPGEDDSGSRRVVVSHAFWLRRFNGSMSALGRELPLNGESYTIVGVMPPGFAESFISWPDSPHIAPELWTLIELKPDVKSDRGARVTYSLGKLKPDATVSRAQSEMAVIANRLAMQYPETNRNIGVSIVPLHEEIVGDVKPTLRVMLGASAFLLLIACANVATLLLARAAKRQKEISIRAAIGASHWRMIRQLLTESFLMSLISCILGLLMAFWILQSLIAISPADLPRMNEVKIDLHVLAFTLTVSVITAIVFGSFSIYHSMRTDLSSLLAQFQGGRHSSIVGRMRALLVVFEISAALLLLVGAMLMIRSFGKLRSVEPGIKTRNLLTMRIVLPPGKYPDASQRADFFTRLRERINNLPGVRSVTAGYSIPFGANNTRVFFTIDGAPQPVPDGWPPVDFNPISSGFFESLGIALRQGRFFSDTDAPDSPKVVIINESMARRFWPGQQAVGQKIGLNMPGRVIKDLQIVGVVADVRQRGLDKDVQPGIFVPYPQFPERTQAMYLVVNTSNAALSQAPAIRAAIWEEDKDQPITMINTMERLVEISTASRRFNMVLLQILAAVAICLALGGVYGLMSYLVAQRTKEIAIRMALGAQPSDVLKLFVSRAMTVILVGVALGLTMSFAATRLMQSLLFEIRAVDHAAFLLSPVLLVIAALLATIAPTYRAIRVNPSAVLRND